MRESTRIILQAIAKLREPAAQTDVLARGQDHATEAGRDE